jgi:thiaminase
VHVGLRGDRRAARRRRRARPRGHAGYAAWIATYADPEFQALAAWARELADTAAADAGDGMRARMHQAFRTCSEHELAFWEAAWCSVGA